ncbi:enoyl-CoA hydratase/isomerase family protein [Sphingomonas sp. RS2018]
MIRVDHDGAIATLTLDRGSAGNAFTLNHWDELAAAIGQLAADRPSAVIIRSADPRFFSAGADLGEMAASLGDSGFGTRLRTRMSRAIEAIAALPMPVIAAVDGSCFGAAVAMTLACDLRIAGDGARFAITPAKLGIAYPAADIARLIATVGRGQATKMLFTAEAIDADEAWRVCLADIRYPVATEEAARLADLIADNDVTAVAALKATLADPLDARHADTFDRLFRGDGFARRLLAFHDRPRTTR